MTEKKKYRIIIIGIIIIGAICLLIEGSIYDKRVTNAVKEKNLHIQKYSNCSTDNILLKNKVEIQEKTIADLEAKISELKK